MNLLSYIKSLISRYGVEFSLIVLVGLGIYSYMKPQFLDFDSPETLMSQETQATILKIKEVVTKADAAENLFLKSRREHDLKAYNEQVVLLNHYMGHLAKLMKSRPEYYQQVMQLNKSLKEHFEMINAALAQRQKGTPVRVPANSSLLPLLETPFFAVKRAPSFVMTKEMKLGLFAFLVCLILLSRFWQHETLSAQFRRAHSLKSRSILLDTILNSMSEALIVIDKEGNFTHYNAAAQRIIGTKVKDVDKDASVQALGFIDIRSGDRFTKRRLPLNRSLHGDKIDDLEILVQNDLHPEGVYISLSSRPLNDINGDIAGALAVFRDVSRRKMVEQEWIRAREAAVEASLKKSDFLAAMSHEIRTPMNGIIGMTTLLSDTPLNEEQKEYVGTVRRSAESLLTLINDILDYSKIEAGKIRLDPQPFDLQFLIHDITETFRPGVAEKNVDLKLNMKDTESWLYIGDQGRLRQILLNLMGNAVKFTEKGAVTLTVTRIEDQNHSRLKFEVKDTGPGMKEEDRLNLFQKYFQTKTGAKFGGTGLGLSISKQLVDLMGGEIGVDSVVGLGSTFWFSVSLPVAAAQSLPSSGDIKFAKIFSGSILLVEDQIVNQRVAQSYLKKLGLDVDVASNGLVAFEKCLKQRYDLIFMDCQMPILDGFEATHKIRKDEQRSGRRTPIIALTADAASNDSRKYTEAGMDDFLPKPLELRALIDTLHRWLKPAADALDVSALERLENYMVKDQNLIQALIDDFAQSVPDLIAQMRAALHVLDHTAISEAAHALKSSSATLGAKRLSELSAALEKSSDFNDMGPLLVQIEEQFAISMQDLRKYSQNKKVA